MFELSDFYTHCRQSNIDVIPFRGAPRAGTTIRCARRTAIFLDFDRIPTTRLLRGVCYHELGHAATGALHKVDSPFETVARSEYRARKWSAEHFLTPSDFQEAFDAGCRELWQLAEYFELPEDDIRTAYNYWQTQPPAGQCRMHNAE